MDRRTPGGYALIALLVVVGVVGVPFAIQFVMGSDYGRAPIDIGDLDGDARVIVEPGDEIAVGLLGHPAHRDVGWEIVGIDDAVVEVIERRHVPKAGTPPDPELLTEMPETVRDLWSTLPERTDPPDAEMEDGQPQWYWPMTHFDLSGAGFGESPVVLELRVDGALVHSFEFSVTVIDGDACDYFVSQESSTKVPHRCG